MSRAPDMPQPAAVTLLIAAMRAAVPGLDASLAKALAEATLRTAVLTRNQGDAVRERRKAQASDDRRERAHWSAQDAGGRSGAPRPSTPWEVLGVPLDASVELINIAWRSKARAAHPDAGGSHEQMSALNAARDTMLRTAGTRR